MSIAAILLAVECVIAPNVERKYFTSGDRIAIEDATYILVTESDWQALSNRVSVLESIAAKRWKIQHSTEHGRVEWHGRRVNTEIDTNSMEKVTHYEDGYRFVEKMEKFRNTASATVSKSAPAKNAPTRKLPAKLAETMRKRKIASSTTNTVNIIRRAK